MAETKIPPHFHYTVEHEWAERAADGTLSIGVTDYAQDALGDITFLELPEVGALITAGQTFGVVESVKTFSDLFAPVTGEVVATNADALANPAAINDDAYAVWLIKVRQTDSDASRLLSAAEYAAHLAANG